MAACIEASAKRVAMNSGYVSPLPGAAAGVNHNHALMAALVETDEPPSVRNRDGNSSFELVLSEDKSAEDIDALQNLRAEISVETQKSGSFAQQVVNAIADGLDNAFESGDFRLELSGPINAEQADNDTVVVHFPGVEVIENYGFDRLKLGDLALTVKRFDETNYGFDTVLPSVIESFTGRWRDDEQIVIAKSAINGIWRADVETLTALDVEASGVSMIAEERDLFGFDGVVSSYKSDQSSDGLWNAESTIVLSDIVLSPDQSDPSLQIGWAKIARVVEDANYDPFLVTDLLDLITGTIDDLEELEQVSNTILQHRIGRTDLEVTLRSTQLLEQDSKILGIGELSLRVILDEREKIHNVLAALEIADIQFDRSEIVRHEIPSEIIPEKAKIEIALIRFPYRPYEEMFQELFDLDDGSELGQELLENDIVREMAAAGSSFRVREIRITAPKFEVLIEGEFQADPNSTFGVSGRIETRIRGIEKMLKLAVERKEMGASGVILLLRGLGRQTQLVESDDPTYSYELNIPSDGSITLNDIPLDSLIEKIESLL